MNIGNNIAEIRKEKNLTQEQLALKINVSPKTISSYETNRSLPNIEILILLAKTLDTSIDKILGLNKDNANNINKKYYLTRIKNSILKIIFLSIILIIPIFYFGYNSTVNFASILVKYYQNGTFDPINSAKIFDSFTYETIKIYLVYVIILLVIYILFLIKKRVPLFVISGILFIIFIYDTFVPNILLFITLITSIITFTFALKSIEYKKRIPLFITSGLLFMIYVFSANIYKDLSGIEFFIVLIPCIISLAFALKIRETNKSLLI